MDIDAILATFRGILFDPSGGGGVEGFVVGLKVYMSRFLGVLVTLFIAYKVMLYFSDIDKKLDPFTIIRPILILCVFAQYQNLTNLLLDTPMTLLNEAVLEGATAIPSVAGGSPSAIQTSLNTGFQSGIEHIDAAPKGPGGVGLYDVLAVFDFFEAIHLLIQFVASVVGYYMLFRQLVLLAIYYVSGLIAIPFSLIAGNQGVLRDWYFGFIAVLMWEPMLNIMKGIITALQVSTRSINDNPLFSVALQLVMITTILQIPNFANLVVSKGASVGSEIGSKMTGRMGSARKSLFGV